MKNTPEETRAFLIKDFIKEFSFTDEYDRPQLYGEFYCAMQERGIEKEEYEPFVKEYKEEKEKQKENIKIASKIFTREGQLEKFYEANPFFYNKSKMFYIWNEAEKKYVISDETDLLNQIGKELGLDTINSKTKAELISGFQQIGRKHIPKDAPTSWVQFKDKICDFKTDETFNATPDYFITNPLPWELGETEDTPTIDKLFIEWVGEDYKTTLEQIASYCISSEQFMQRLIALVGGGSNGKGTYIKFLKRLLGADNIVSSELKELSENQFETASIYKKLACVMGEISYDDLKNTNQIKKLAGEDDIRYCFKGKTPFTEKSITTLITATNSLPRTPDKTIGFYRKFLIVDFPNQFTDIKHGIIESIPEQEMQNFCKKMMRILKELYQIQKFDNEGTFEERMNRYEERSNPVLKFIESKCTEIVGENTELRVFTNYFNEYATKNHLRVLSVKQVGSVLRDEGYETGKRKINQNTPNEQSFVAILNLKVNITTQTTETTKSSSQFLRKETISDLSSLGGYGSYLDKDTPKSKLTFTKEELAQAGLTEKDYLDSMKGGAI